LDAAAALLAIGIAVEPLPILATVLLLTTRNGRSKATGFLVGWMLALAFCIGGTVLAANNVPSQSGGLPSGCAAAIDLLIGVLLLFLAYRRRPALQGREGALSTPHWMSRLDSVSPLVALGFGMLLPPYMVAVAIGTDLAAQNATAMHTVIAVLVYVVIASLGALIPLLVSVLQPATSHARLERWRSWLQQHWLTVLFWLLLVLGWYLIAKGIINLT